MRRPQYTDLVDRLPSTVPFVGPETQERAKRQTFKARIGANESVFGPSPQAIRAMAEAAAAVWQYGDPENHDLKVALARHHGVEPANIVVGEGIDGLLGYLARMFVTEGTPVVTSLGAYPTFNFHVAGFGGTLHMASYKDDHEDPDAVIGLARQEKARLIYFANPDNPMGTWHGADRIEELIRDVPEDAILCLDEAYTEFAPEGTSPTIDVTNPSVIRFRTFSKAYGMAGARIGYGIGEVGLIDAFNKIRNHFGVNRIAQAGALASLEDAAYVQEVRDKVRRSCQAIASIATEHGLKPLPTATNFVAIDCGGTDRATAILKGLVDAGVFVRMPGVAPLNRCIRISAGTESDLATLRALLPGVLSAADS